MDRCYPARLLDPDLSNLHGSPGDDCAAGIHDWDEPRLHTEVDEWLTSRSCSFQPSSVMIHGPVTLDPLRGRQGPMTTEQGKLWNAIGFASE